MKGMCRISWELGESAIRRHQMKGQYRGIPEETKAWRWECEGAHLVIDTRFDAFLDQSIIPRLDDLRC